MTPEDHGEAREPQTWAEIRCCLRQSAKAAST